jgi:hypothetical protein
MRILTILDCCNTGKPYRRLCVVPAGFSKQCNFLPLPEWQPNQPKPSTWPLHIHPPKEVYQ